MFLSIIIAAYNVELFIEKCVLSAVMQLGFDHSYEIIIIDDGSTDATLLILKKLQKAYENIVVVTQQNSGLGAARNIGLKHANGEFVWFIDGDDYIEENILKKILNVINLKNLDALALNYNVVDDKYNVSTRHTNDIKMEREIVTGCEFYQANYAKSYTWSYIFKRTIFTKSDICFKERINMQDSEILPKLMLEIQKISFLEEVCYYYVQHPNSYTNSNNGQKRLKYFESIIEVEASLKSFLLNEAKNNIQIKKGLEKKIEGLHNVLFNHLLFFSYEKEWLLKIIKLLKKNNLYPLQNKAKGKMQLLKIGFNSCPIATKWVVDKIRVLRK